MSSENTYDDELLSILSQERNIIDFFDKIFDFLRRRTDYFKIKRSDSDNMGLEVGEAEKILRSVFCNHMKVAMKEQNINLEPIVDPVPPDYVQEEIIETSESTENIDKSEIINENCSTIAATSTESKKFENSESTTKHPDDLSDPKIPVMDPDCYNGGCCDGYTWSQTLKDVDISVKVSPETISGKHVRVNIQQTCLKVEIVEDGNWKVLKEGTLSWKINVEESTWTLVPREHILICLQKMKERWWDSAFAADPKIDLKAIDPSIPYEDLDRDSQVKIDELLYNEHMKRLGKPNIQQTKLHGILKDAWDAEGSPFKGQPFDPSLVNIQNAENFKI